MDMLLDYDNFKIMTLQRKSAELYAYLEGCDKIDTVEAWYMGRNGTFESVPLYQALVVFAAFFSTFSYDIQYTPIKALLHCKSSILPLSEVRFYYVVDKILII